MTTGTITKFPINTILEFATSADYGLCPTLCGEVTDLNEASHNHAVSESGIKQAIIDASIDNIVFINLGDGYGIHAYSDEITAYFNTISANSDYLTGWIDNNTLILSAWGESLSSTTAGSGIYDANLSVQGGKFQYSNTIAASAIPSTGQVLANAQQDDIIGKIFIKCFTPVEPNGTRFSIGINGDTERYTSQFNTPTAQGLFTDWSYAHGLTAEYDWLSANTDILLYKYGNTPASGSIGISIFYDQAEWPS